MIYKISFNLELNEAEELVLKKVLGTKDDVIDDVNINKLSKTALSEYVDMITNQGIPSRNQDLKTKRLLFLIENYFVDTLPTETELINLFRINERNAKTLIDDTISLYQNRIESNLVVSIKNSLMNFIYDEDDESYDGVIESKVLLDKINEIITHEMPGLESLRKKKNTSGKYTCKIDTYNFLKEKYLSETGEYTNE